MGRDTPPSPAQIRGHKDLLATGGLYVWFDEAGLTCDMEGHAQKAEKLLDQINEELKLAVEAANKNKGK